MVKEPIIRTANLSDQSRIDSFLSKKNLLIHRHLDWRQPLDWLGYSPFLILEMDNQIRSLLVCPAEIDDIYWIRLFASSYSSPVDEYFRILLGKAVENIIAIHRSILIASIAYQGWMSDLLDRNGWKKYQEVVQLRWNKREVINSHESSSGELVIRKMHVPDLPVVTEIDQICFERLWQQSPNAIELAYEQSSYATVAERGGRIVGFQISTSLRNHTHIARLAVLPEFQRQKIGNHLIKDVLENFRKPWTREITVNTQKDNFKSLGLYTQLGFEMTNDGFPIYIFQK